MITLITIFFFVLGLVIGSFLNVIILRFGTHRTLGGRSICMSCETQLSWYELIPFFSFLGLLGRCRSCRSRISAMYPIVEFFTGLVFAGLFLKFQDIFFLDTLIFVFTYLYYAFAFSVLIIIAFYDIRHKIIPDRLTLTLGALAFVGLFFFDAYGFRVHMPGAAEFLSGVWIAIPFALFWLVSAGRWMGLGDAKLAAGLGWLIGTSRVLSAAVISFWSGAILGVGLILFSKRYGMKTEIPFAPFLVFSAITAFLFELHIFPFF